MMTEAESGRERDELARRMYELLDQDGTLTVPDGVLRKVIRFMTDHRM